MNKQEIYKQIETHYRTNYSKLVKNLSFSINLNVHDAEDIIQEAYTRACQYWNSYISDMDFDSWFSSILSNCIKDKHNEINNVGITDKVLFPNHERPRPLNKLLVEDIKKIIDNKEKPVKKILLLYFILQYSLKDIVKIVPNSYSSIENITRSFRKELKDIFKTRLFENN
jgi:RNA polymerase sigma factor (sigma-70 family)